MGQGESYVRRHAKATPLGLLGLLSIIGLLLVPASASAAQLHVLSTSFGNAGSGDGQLSLGEHSGLAVNDESGDVYVADTANHRVVEFDPSKPANERFIRAFGADVGGAGVDVCTTGCTAGTGGSAPGQLQSPTFIAIDNSAGSSRGDVYVADSANNTVTKFGSAGNLLSGWGSGGQLTGSGVPFAVIGGIIIDAGGNLNVLTVEDQAMSRFDEADAFKETVNPPRGTFPGGLSIDTEGNFYKIDGSPEVTKFTPSGEDLGEPDIRADGLALANDPDNGELYVIQAEGGGFVNRFGLNCGQGCAPLESFGSGVLANPQGIAVGADGTTYVTEAGASKVDVFVSALLPNAETKEATSVKKTSATLNGSIGADGGPQASCEFQYVTEAHFQSEGFTGATSVPCNPAGPFTGSSTQAVKADISSLTTGTSYRFRVVAANANGTNRGEDLIFTTTQLATTRSATEVKGSTATLNGIVRPEGEAIVSCIFEYGTSTVFGQSAPCEGAIPTDEGEHAVTAALTHLAPNSRFHFRLVINRGSGPIGGDDRLLITQATVITGDASAIAPPTASVEGTVNPEGTVFTACSFEYGPTDAYGSSAPCAESPATIGSGESPVVVHADLSELTFGTTYHYRLTATNAEGTSTGEDKSFNTPGALIESSRAISVGLEEATLETKINPAGQATEYLIEYGTDTSYGSSTPNTPIGAESTVQTVSDTLASLTPNTTYHWRVVATNSVATSVGPDGSFTTFAPIPAPETGCPNQAFRTGPGAALADCRAYEQATPVDKHGANSTGNPGFVQASRSGNRVTFGNAAGLPTTGGSSSASPFVASRGTDSWTSNGILPLTAPGTRAQALGWDEEIASVASAPSTGGIYLGDTAARTFSLAVPTPKFIFPVLAGFADDPAHLIFEVAERQPLVSGAVDGKHNTYDLDHGNLTLVGRIPVGTATSCDDASGPACVPAPNGAFPGPYRWDGSNTEDGGVGTGLSPRQNPISDDGSKVFFTAAGSGQLYVREGGSATTKISASQASVADPNGPKPAVFVAATPDGSKVFFTSCEKLTDDSTAVSTVEPYCKSDGGQGSGSDLYSYDTESGELTDLTVDSNVSDSVRAGVVGGVGISADGSYVYFVANGVLAPGSSPGKCQFGIGTSDENGSCNLYLYHDGTTTFIARLNARTSDIDNWFGAGRVAANGTLLFSSTASLTGYDNTLADQAAGECSEKHCRELFRYAPSKGDLNCVSCPPSGVAPSGPAQIESVRQSGVEAPRSNVVTRNLSNDGTRLFFDSPDPLVAADTNGVMDAYEWEAEGTGSCDSSGANGGCLYLLSTGTSPEPSYLGDVSATGDDAFIFTDQPLVPADGDELSDVYDARVDGGLASQHQGEGQAPCLGEACKGASSTAPSEQSPGSASFSGPGNETQKPTKRCGKGAKKCKKKHHKKSKSKKHRGAHNNRGGSK